MFETEEQREKRIAEKRDAARPHPGVNYDARIDRFTAEIYIDGARKWLGSYHEIEPAIEAYQQARQERPPRTGSFNAIYRAFREAHGGERGTPPAGAVLEYDGQRYKFHGVTFRKGKGGGPYAYYEWESACKTCGEFFLTRTAAPVSMCKGITRNCPEHSRGAPRTKASTPERAAPRAAPAPKPLTGPQKIAAEEAEKLSLLYDKMPLADFLERVAGLIPPSPYHSPEGFVKFITRWGEDSEDCPFCIVNDEVFFP